MTLPTPGRPSRSLAPLDRGRRCWSDREEEILIGTLKELVATGWKADNGFRGGYLGKIEDALRREFPNTDLKVNPHIQSKIHTWKKHYGALSQVLSRSGIGFNLYGDYKIDCDDAAWTDILKSDPGVKGIRNKSWPYYDDWKIVFGKDRACGEHAVGPREAYQQNFSGSSQVFAGEGSSYHVPDPFLGDDSASHALSPEAQTDSGFSAAGGSDPKENAPKERAPKKRKTKEDALDRLVDVIGKMHEDTNNRLEYLANRIGYEFELTKSRKEVFNLVGVIPGLTLDQVFDASAIILSKVENLDFFMSLHEVARQAYVYRALEKFNGN
ncbi:hypothetical protein SASPL_116767 [Salvia splendens]|uniref:Myb/SANT-like domain-containing protein n=1 Tax=Salvia splendens TaxID=180675 RepID=A0A8X8XY05_SALSN|nr:hypothetical protein SASPL_116767 [Salvia splendens]